MLIITDMDIVGLVLFKKPCWLNCTVTYFVDLTVVLNALTCKHALKMITFCQGVYQGI